MGASGGAVTDARRASPNGGGVAHSLLREGIGAHVVSLLRAERPMPAVDGDDVLPAVDFVGHRRRLTARREAVLPQHVARGDVERANIVIHRCDGRSRDQTRLCRFQPAALVRIAPIAPSASRSTAGRRATLPAPLTPVGSTRGSAAEMRSARSRRQLVVATGPRAPCRLESRVSLWAPTSPATRRRSPRT